MADDWISIQDAAEASGYHPEHIRRLIRKSERDREDSGKPSLDFKYRKFADVWQVDRISLAEHVKRIKGTKDRRRGPKGQI